MVENSDSAVVVLDRPNESIESRYTSPSDSSSHDEASLVGNYWTNDHNGDNEGGDMVEVNKDLDFDSAREFWERKETERVKENDRRLEPYDDLTREQVREMSIQDYRTFLSDIEDARISKGYRIALHHIDTIVSRLRTDIEGFETASAGGEVGRQEMISSLGTDTCLILNELYIRAHDLIDHQTWQQLYSHTHSHNKDVRYHSLSSIEGLMKIGGFVMDNQDIVSGFLDDFEEDLIHPIHEEDRDLDDVIAQTAGFALRKEFYDLDHQHEEFGRYVVDIYKMADDSQVRRITKIFSEVANIEIILKILSTYSIVDPDINAKFEKVQELFVPKEARSYIDIAKLYEDINFKDYKPNKELNEFETNLLLKELPEDGKVLVFGCGPGREVNDLYNYGRDVYGFDLVEDHIKQAVELNPALFGRVKVGSWSDDIPFQRNSFKSVSMLGRTFLHNTTIEDGRICLMSIHDMLTEDGIAIIDLPDVAYGHYKKERKRFDEAVQRLGGGYHEAGSIWDSPDEKNYIKRLAPTELQFKSMAILSGFKAEKIATRDFITSDGEKNVNVYWKLVKHKPFEYDLDWAFDYIDDDLVFDSDD